MLTSKQRAFLQKKAHSIDPRIWLGKDGPTDALCRALDTQLDLDEVVKIRFVACKEERQHIAQTLAENTGSYFVRLVGNVAIFYRQSRIPEKRTIALP